jgi:hypothetical protein
MYLNPYLTEILCRRDQTKFIKPKWRLQVSKIGEIRDNMKENPKYYKESAFQKVSWVTKAKQYLKQKGSYSFNWK